VKKFINRTPNIIKAAKDDSLDTESKKAKGIDSLLIVQSIDCLPKTMKVLHALTHNHTIVPYKWVMDCHRARDFLDFNDYKYIHERPLNDLFKKYTFQIMPKSHFQNSKQI